MAFIEKTPRMRFQPFDNTLGDWKNWHQGWKEVYMWKRLSEGWIWIAAVIDFALSFGLAHLLVHFGVRWSYMMDQPLDASNSILGFTVVFGVFLPFIALFGGAMVAGQVGLAASDGRSPVRTGVWGR